MAKGFLFRVLVSGLCLLAVAGCQTTSKPVASGTRQSVTAQAVTVQPVSASTLPAAQSKVAGNAGARVRGYSEYVMDLATGRELSSLNADEIRYPASLTKMMTLYLLFEALEAGQYTLSSPLTVSKNATSRPPAKLGLKTGQTITIEQAAQALAIKSANDVAVVVAENLAGSEAAFAQKMTAKARALGMGNTRFVNASGLYDAAHVTTARDMARLGRALKTRFARYGRFFRAKSFVFAGRTYQATNNLLGKVAGVDGLKTGYVSLAGYNLVATANRSGQQRLVVVMGGKSEAARDRQVIRLLNDSF